MCNTLNTLMEELNKSTNTTKRSNGLAFNLRLHYASCDKVECIKMNGSYYKPFSF